MRPSLKSACVAVVFACLAGAAHSQSLAGFSMPTEAEVAALAAQGALPGDDALTCEQIGAAFAPYAQTMAPEAEALGQTAGQIQSNGAKQMSQMKSQMMVGAGVGMITGVAGAFIPGMGYLAQAQQMAMAAQMQKQADAAKPLQDQMMAQSGALLATMGPMMREPRFQRLMQLAQAKKCEGPSQP
jgi:hypothetical protein